MARSNRSPKIRLGELLVAAGLVSDEKVRMGLEEQRRNNLFLGEALTLKVMMENAQQVIQPMTEKMAGASVSASRQVTPRWP